MNIALFAQQMVELAQENPHLDVYIASDEEGNSFNTLEDYSLYLVEQGAGQSLESGEIFSREDLIVDEGYEEHEIDNAFKPILVLWP